MVDSSRHAEFVELLRRHQQQVFAYLFALVRNLHDAEDLFQQASLIWHAKFDEFQPGTNFVAWACRIAKLEVMNFYRRRGRNPVTFSTKLQDELAVVAAQSETEFTAERMQALNHCMGQLSDSDRELLDLVYSKELSVQQVARERRRPLKSIYNSLGRIRNALHECIRRTLAQEERS